MKIKFGGKTGIVCKYGTFEPDKEYQVSKEVGKALLKVAGFKEVKEVKNKERGEK